MIARQFTSNTDRTLHHHNGDFYRWRESHYTEESNETVRAAVYNFLDGASYEKNGEMVPFNPNKSKVANVMEALAAEAQLPSSTRAPCWLDDAEHPDAADILPCSNGLLHLPTRRLLPKTPAFFGLNAVDYGFKADAPQPEAWLQFMASIWPNDQESIDTLQELFGLLLTGDTSHQKAMLIVGPKRCGKGTIARVLTALLGKENVAGPTLSSLSQNFGMAPLIGKPLAIISDARLGNRTDGNVIAERLLSITGEDALGVPRKFKEDWTGRLPTRFLILTNELPRLTDASGALASRFIVLVMARSFYGQEDHRLTDKLVAELPGILLWAMDGRDRLAARKYFKQPASAMQTVQALEDLGSPIGTFIRDMCVVDPTRCVDCEKLYRAWVTWCTDQGRDHPGTVQTFGKDLRASVTGLDVTQVRDMATGERSRYYQGIDLDDRYMA
jgi:putative DNA primase/helicase